MQCLWVTSFLIFSHYVLHTHLSAGLAHLMLQCNKQHDAGWLGLKLQPNRPVLTPPFLEPYDCNKETTHSDTVSVYFQLQTWLCVGMY